ncbi:TolC family protein [Alteromonas sp. SM 2104]|nr:TolC family protein [Alteromonas oceanisediminis]
MAIAAVGVAHGQSTPLMSLSKTVEIAVNNDPWLAGSELRQRAMLSSSVAAASLPDPVVSLSMANVPTNGFALDQEPMTQLKTGVSQVFPRGDSLAIRSRQLAQQAAEHPLKRADRIAKTRVTVSEIWLDIYRAQQSIRLISQDRALFQQLSDIATANYSAAVGRVRQQDVVQAKLELTRLEDRLATLSALEERAVGQLMQWIITDVSASNIGNSAQGRLLLPENLPDIQPLPSPALDAIERKDFGALAEWLAQHPYVRAIEQRLLVSQTGIALAQEKYQPQWALNASYAFRDDTPAGTSRADFLSIGVSFDVPLFTDKRQDQDVAAAVDLSEALKTDRLLALREMIAASQALYAERQRLSQRRVLYQDELLALTQEQATASLNAYTNDDGDFAEVVRARIADLNARVDALDIDVAWAKNQIRLHYYLNPSADIPITHRGEQP